MPVERRIYIKEDYIEKLTQLAEVITGADVPGLVNDAVKVFLENEFEPRMIREKEFREEMAKRTSAKRQAVA